MIGLGTLRLIVTRTGESELLRRDNYRGASIPVVGGIPIIVVAILGMTVLRIVRSLTELEVFADQALIWVEPALVALLVVAVFGLLDDSMGSAAAKGFRGHIGSLLSGRLTTGMLKLLAGGLAGLVVASSLETNLGWLILGGLCVAVWSNVGNLFDLAPGRCLKVCVPLPLVLVALFPGRLAPLALVVGAAMAVFASDVKEKVMLGDTGANPAGVLVALAAVACGNHWVTAAFCLGGVLLNLSAERVSFSRIIYRTSALRRVDLWGTLPERRQFLAEQ